MMKKIVIATLLLFITFTTAIADEITFVTSAPNTVVLNQQFRLKYILNQRGTSEPRVPTIENFTILAGPYRSEQQSTTIVNGQVTSSSQVTYTYTLQADKEGEFTIPGASINIDGKNYTSNSVKIKVLPQDKTTASQTTRRNNQQSNSANISDKDLFMTATLNKTKVYEQEAVLLTFKVYSAVNLTALNGKIPDLKDFQIQEIKLPSEKEWQLEHYNGRNYRSILWQQYVLFPQKSGIIEIPSSTYEGVVSVQTRSYDPFDFFGSTGYIEVKKAIKTPKLRLDVQSLPQGKPENFSGGVGNFNISSSISTTELKANEAVTLRLVISGTGNMKLIKTPEISLPEDFEIYDPKIDNQLTLKTNGFSGKKIIEYIFIPRYAGEYTIPSVQFSYFDTSTKQYKTQTTDSYTLNVKKGEETSGGAVATYISKEELKMIGQDIRFIKRGESRLNKEREYLFASAIYYLCYIIPLILFIVCIIIYRKQMAENANIAISRTKKANKVAVKRLKVAKILLKENKKNEFYDEILKILWGYMSDKLSIPVSQLSKDNITAKLEERGVEEPLINELHNVLNEAEFARYAPGDAGAAMDKVYNMAINVISKMENSIKR